MYAPKLGKFARGNGHRTFDWVRFRSVQVFLVEFTDACSFLVWPGADNRATRYFALPESMWTRVQVFAGGDVLIAMLSLD